MSECALEQVSPLPENIMLTENGAFSHISSLDALIDLHFFSIRGADVSKLVDLCDKVLTQNFTLIDQEISISGAEALSRYLVYLRHFRNGFGKGEKKVYHALLNHLFKKSERALDWFMNNDIIQNIGCWKDYYCLTGKKLKKLVIRKFVNQLTRDKDSDHPSLCAKWAPTKNSVKGANFYQALIHTVFPHSKCAEQDYRKVVSSIRKKLNLVETHLSQGRYDLINYQHVPSFALKRYTKTFSSNDPIRFREYVQRVNTGEAKINVTGRELNDLVQSIFSGKDVEVCNLVFQELLTQGTAFDRNCIVIADTSGSMKGTPINVAVGLAMYAACLNAQTFTPEQFASLHLRYANLPDPSEVAKYQIGTWWSFSDDPHVNYVVKSCILTNGQEKIFSLSDILENLDRGNWEMTTDFERVYLKLLETEQTFDDVIVVSDMQFNQCVNNAESTLFENMKEQFASQNKPMPKMIFWNVRSSTVLVTNNETNTLLVSGYSPNILNDVMTGKTTTTDFMSELLIKVGTMFTPFKNV